MNTEVARTVVSECTLLPFCLSLLETLAGVAPLTAIVMTVLQLSKGGRSLWRATARHRLAVENRREELLQKLTFFLSSLRYVYNKYPPDMLPPALQAERQAFLDTDFRNLTTLSALSLPELEALFADVQRECTTGKWQGGVAAVERRVEDAVRQAGRHQDGRERQGEVRDG
jgi:hypothetical protein